MAPHREHTHHTQWATGTGAQTVFYLERTPRREGSLRVTVAGLLLRPADRGTAYNYSIDDNKVTFVAAPALNANICFEVTF